MPTERFEEPGVQLWGPQDPAEPAVQEWSEPAGWATPAAAAHGLPFEPDPPDFADSAEENRTLFWLFVHLRHEAWNLRFVDKLPAPWSPDPVLNKVRFTNVYRLLDRGTQFLVSEVQEKLCADTRQAVFATLVYRLFNRIETWQAIEAQLLANDELGLYETFRGMLRAGQKIFTGAYMSVSLPRRAEGDRAADMVTAIRACRDTAGELNSLIARSDYQYDLEDLYSIVERETPGFGRFLSYMCATDLCWPLLNLGGPGADWGTLAPMASVDQWAKCGPGAVKGLQLLGCGGDERARLDEMHRMRASQRQEFARIGAPFRFLRDCRGREVELSLLDVEHSLCEFQKYHRALSGGAVKTVYGNTPASAWRPDYLTCPAWEGGYGS